jgi:hypothetical protein
VLLDNKNNGHVGNTLREHLAAGSILSVLSSQFTIYGFAALKKELARVESTRLAAINGCNDDGFLTFDHGVENFIEVGAEFDHRNGVGHGECPRRFGWIAISDEAGGCRSFCQIAAVTE